MKKYYLLIVLLVAFGRSMAQDPQFSQFYAAPLYHNPAFAGSAFATRLIANYRNQWPSIDANFVTSAFSIDHYIEKLNSGVGILVMNDSQGPGRLKSTELSGLYSYQLRLNEESFLRLGVQGTYSNKTLDYVGLTFGDQYTNKGYTGAPSNDPFANIEFKPIHRVDFTGGALFYNRLTWLGVSVHHINQPKYSFLENATTTSSINVIPRKISVSGGIKIPIMNQISGAAFGDKEFSISPAFLFKNQGKFNQLDLGFYTTYSSLTAGLWYRGIPLKPKNISRTNHDAAVILLGYRHDKFSIGYSYDVTISSLGYSTGGAHEISIAYQLEKFEREKSKRRQSKKELSCPKF